MGVLIRVCETRNHSMAKILKWPTIPGHLDGTECRIERDHGRLRAVNECVKAIRFDPLAVTSMPWISPRARRKGSLSRLPRSPFLAGFRYGPTGYWVAKFAMIGSSPNPHDGWSKLFAVGGLLSIKLSLVKPSPTPPGMLSRPSASRTLHAMM
jgi:hypothetical protein